MSWRVNSQNVGSCNLVFRLLHCSVVTSHHNTSTVRSKLNHFRLPHAAKTPCHHGDQCLTDAISICFANVLQSNKLGKDRPMYCQSNNKFWLPVRTVCGSVRYHGPKLCFLNQWKCDIALIVAIAFIKSWQLLSFRYAVPTFKPLASSKEHSHWKSLNGRPCFATAWADVNNIFICSMVFWFSFISILCVTVASGFFVASNRIWFCLWLSNLLQV